MRLLNKHNFKSIYHRLLVYFVEIAIIFIGITISFLFEQWREENRQRQELIELAESLLRDAEIGKVRLTSDLNGTNIWLLNLDSLRIQRELEKISESRLIWFSDLMTGKEFGLFDSKSPAYLSAISNGSLSKLPDTIQLKIYDVYENQLPSFKYLYDQQLETVKHFRNEIMIHSNIYLYHTNSSTVSIDLKKFAHEVQHPTYGNLINQIITTEKAVRGINMKLKEDFDSIIRTLRDYIEVLKK